MTRPILQELVIEQGYGTSAMGNEIVILKANKIVSLNEMESGTRNATETEKQSDVDGFFEAFGMQKVHHRSRKHCEFSLCLFVFLS